MVLQDYTGKKCDVYCNSRVKSVTRRRGSEVRRAQTVERDDIVPRGEPIAVKLSQQNQLRGMIQNKCTCVPLRDLYRACDLIVKNSDGLQEKTGNQDV